MSKLIYRTILIFFALFLCGGPSGFSIANSGKLLTVPPITNDHHRYCLGLLKLALSYSDAKYVIEFANDSLSQTRELQRINDGSLDVIWLATSTDFESLARPVRVPLYRGLLGHRIFIIRKGEQGRFNHIDSAEGLRGITFGQGADWADSSILEANGMNVVRVREYANLFYMLDGGRFDAFPRGIHEPWQEIANHPQLSFEVEKKLAFVYRMPMYFFVNKDNPALARDIEQGLFKAIEDGSFDRYFFDNSIIRDALARAGLEHRTIFFLQNPVLPPGTPVDDERLWWAPPSAPAKSLAPPLEQSPGVSVFNLR